MIGRSFFFQVLFVSLFGLMLFAVLASFAWNAIGGEQFNQGLFERSSALVELLLPPAEASQADQQAAVQLVAEKLKLHATVFNQSGQVIAASSDPALWVKPNVAPGTWQPMDGQRRWLTVLSDGRVLSISLDRPVQPNETLAVTLTFGLLALVISAFLFPITRRVTRRLERLQQDVEQIGADNLSARVKIDGQDEIAKLAASFNKSTETIEDLVNRQRLLLANASHELRTPLARIRMGIELLERKNTEERREEMREDIRELDALIDDLITMARFDADASQVGNDAVDLFSVAEEECAHLEYCSLIGDVAVVDGDRRMLQHMLRNLLDNARKHGAAPYTVTVRQTGNSTFLTVQDSGLGIRPEDRKQVFEPFYRGKGKQNQSGYGLGLPLVARIAKAHGATVEINNDPASQITVRFASSNA